MAKRKPTGFIRMTNYRVGCSGLVAPGKEIQIASIKAEQRVTGRTSSATAPRQNIDLPQSAAQIEDGIRADFF
jgi:hypothetical protein